MPENVLVKDGAKYEGQYVAKRSFRDKKILSHGTDPIKVYRAAQKKGARNPVIFYIPEKDSVHIY